MAYLDGQDKRAAVIVRKLCEALDIPNYRDIRDISFHFPRDGPCTYDATFLIDGNKVEYRTLTIEG